MTLAGKYVFTNITVKTLRSLELGLVNLQWALYLYIVIFPEGRIFD